MTMYARVTYEHNHECQKEGEQFVHLPPFIENFSFVVPEYRCVEFPNDLLKIVNVEVEGIPVPVEEPGTGVLDESDVPEAPAE